MENNNICKQHSGCVADINNLKTSMHELWTYTKGIQDEMKKDINDAKEAIQATSNRIQARINVILGGIAVACILMVVNILIGK